MVYDCGACLAKYILCLLNFVFFIFNQDQEKSLVQYILKCAGHYYGLSITELRQLAYQLSKKIDVCPEGWEDEKMAPRHWYYKFMKRHPQLVLRTPEQTSMNRAKAFCKSNVDLFFQNFNSVLTSEHDIMATNIFNMDESGFSTVPSKIGKVIALKGMRRVGKMEAAERGTMVTMALTVSAAGNSLPPFFLFPRKKLQSSFLDSVSSGTVGYANGSGWMCQPEFVHYMRHFIAFAKPSLASPVILLMDNHCSHLSVEAIDLAIENGVHIVTFPPHCSHRLQPLDVSVFGPVKAYYKSQCSAWQKNNANKLVGSIVLSVGVWLALEKESFISLLRVVPKEYLSEFTQPAVIEQASYLLIAAGGFMFIVSFLGYCGALRESSCLLTTYGLCLIIILILEVTAGGLAVAYRGKAETETRGFLKDSLSKYYASGNKTDAVTVMWNHLQAQLKCCGVDDYKDFKNTAWMKQEGKTIPESCCVLEDQISFKPLSPSCTVSPNEVNSYYNKGCFQALMNWIMSNINIIIIVGIGLGVMELVCTFLAFCLSKTINSYLKY